ncbi:MAG TPA: TIR domain-containing protein [Solirubrobacterales bacterium]|jgi:hypothetical protein
MNAPDDPPSLKIFINYRRADSSGHAGRLYDALVREIGEDSVFMDIDKIDLGIDFTEAIDSAVGSCDVLLAVIGREWLTLAGEDGGPRLESPNDYVRLELEAAMRRSEVRIIPLLIEGAAMPGSEQLPESLSRFARFQAHELSDTRFHYDVRRLIGALQRLAQKEGREREAERERVAREAEEGQRAREEMAASEAREREAREAAEQRQLEVEQQSEAERRRQDERAREEAAAVAESAPSDSAPPAATESPRPWTRSPLLLLGIGALGLVLAGVVLAVAGVFAGGKGGGAEASVPSGDVAIVKQVPVATGTVTEADFERRMEQKVAEEKLEEAPAPGSKKLNQLRTAVVEELLDTIWLQGEAEDLGISVTAGQIERKKNKIKEESFPTKSEYQEFLTADRLTEAEVDERVETQLLANAILQEVESGVPANQQKQAKKRYVDEYNEKWRARTVCATGYVVDKCSNS